MPNKPKAKHRKPQPPARRPEVLGVRETASLLTVSVDTVYDLFARGELPGRKVGKKWITTRAGVLRWLEASASNDTLGRAIEGGDAAALAKALNNGKVRVKSNARGS
jgi:excisionase family DNA binding protein